MIQILIGKMWQISGMQVDPEVKEEEEERDPQSPEVSISLCEPSFYFFISDMRVCYRLRTVKKFPDFQANFKNST